MSHENASIPTHEKNVHVIELELISVTGKDEIEFLNEKGKNLSDEDCKIIEIDFELLQHSELEIICFNKQQLYQQQLSKSTLIFFT